MDTATTNDTEIIEMLQTPMDEGMQGFPAVAARMYNLAMQFEREPHLGAGRYERTGERTGYANGHKPKTLKTAAGNLRLRIPQVRGSDRPFYPRSPERGTRSDRAVRMAVSEMYVKGVSTRKVQSVFEEPCDVDVTAEQVSRVMRELDGELENWRNRPIGVVKVLFAGATCHKVRVNGVVVATAVRQFLRTNNMEENLNRQIRQRTRLIPAFPNVDSLPGLVSAICVEISDEWETNGYRYMSAIKEL